MSNKNAQSNSNVLTIKTVQIAPFRTLMTALKDILLETNITFTKDGIKIIIEVREAKDIRTNSQNRLWWKWMEIISSEIGYEKQEIHDILKYKFLLREEMILKLL